MFATGRDVSGSSASIASTEARHPPKVFISYSHDPLLPQAFDEQFQRKKRKEEQRTYVYALAQYLRSKGIDCMIDQYVEDSPPSNWAQWMESQFDDSDYVLMVCSPAYKHYVTNRNDEGRRLQQREGRGSQFEGRLIYSCIANKPSTAEKFIPIFFGKQRPEEVPLVVKQASCYEIFFPPDMTCEGQGDLQRLYAKLTKQDYGLKPPPLGSIESFSSAVSSVQQATPSDDEAITEDFMQAITADGLDLEDMDVTFEQVTKMMNSGKKIATFCCQHKEPIVVATANNDLLENSIEEKESVRELREVTAFSRLSWVKQITKVNVSCKASVNGGSCQAIKERVSYDRFSSISSSRSGVLSIPTSFSFGFCPGPQKPCQTEVMLRLQQLKNARCFSIPKKEIVLASSQGLEALHLKEPSGLVGIGYSMRPGVNGALLQLAMRGHVRKASLSAVVVRVVVEIESSRQQNVQQPIVVLDRVSDNSS